MTLLDENSVVLQRLYEAWVVRDYWSVSESSCLFLGVEPGGKTQASGYAELEAKLGVAASAGELETSGDTVPGSNSLKFEPAKVYGWARQNDIDLPQELVNLMEFVMKTFMTNVDHSEYEQKPEGDFDAERLLGACLAVLVNYPEECKNDNGKIKPEKVLKLIDQYSDSLFGNSLPDLSSTGIYDLMNTWIYKLKD